MRTVVSTNSRGSHYGRLGLGSAIGQTLKASTGCATVKTPAWGKCVLTAILLLTSPTYLPGEDSIVRIEEDWEMLVNAPDSRFDSPQASTTLSPGGRNGGLSFLVNINHGATPEFSPGGLQLTTIHGGAPTISKRLLKGQQLKKDGEILKWTLVVQRAESGLYVGLLNGNSETWGKFGGATSFLHIPYEQAGITSLEDYAAEDSTKKASIHVQSRHTSRLRLRRVRLYQGEEPPTERELNVEIP